MPDAVVAVEHGHREQDRAELPDAEEDRRRLGGGGQDDRDPVAPRHPSRRERVRRLVREVLELSPVELPRRAVEALPDHRRLVARMLVAHVGGDVVARRHLPAMGCAQLLVALSADGVPPRDAGSVAAIISCRDRVSLARMAGSGTPTRLWHPFAAMGKVDGHELVLTRGEGCRVWDADGNEYLDATAGLWFANVGHGRAEIADAVADAAADARRAPHLRRPRQRARARARGARGRARARRRPRRLLRHRRRRGDRHRGEDRPPLLGAHRPAASGR